MSVYVWKSVARVECWYGGCADEYDQQSVCEDWGCGPNVTALAVCGSAGSSYPQVWVPARLGEEKELYGGDELEHAKMATFG